jgi:hypothetical protein
MRSKVPIVKARPARHVVLSLVVLAAATACLDVTGTRAADSQIRVVNATGQTLNLLMDDRLAVEASQQLNISLIQIAAGVHTLTFRTLDGAETPITVTTTPLGIRTAYAYTYASGEVIGIILDTIAPPPAGKASVRAINLSKTAGAVDIYGSQPAGTAGTLFVSPFSYLTASSFMQRDAGKWEIYLTDAGSSNKILTTGEVNIESQGRRTVFLIDSASVPVFRVLPE